MMFRFSLTTVIKPISSTSMRYFSSAACLLSKSSGRNVPTMRSAAPRSVLAAGAGSSGSSSSNNISYVGTARPYQHRPSSSSSTSVKYIKLADPAPGSPFHYAFPVHDLEVAKQFYGEVLGCAEGRSSDKWQDYSLHGHQIVAHWAGNDYRCQDYYNPVDGDEVPVPHAGLALTEEQFHAMAARLRKNGIQFVIEPHLRFKGTPGEQWTMFFKDPSGNNLEFKAVTTIDNLFAKYNVVE